MNTWFNLRLWFALVAVALAPLSKAEWVVGMQAPDFSAYALEGDLPEVSGKVVYVDFWASWCPPCRVSFPEIDSLYQAYKDRGFEVLAVSVDSKRSSMEKFVKRVKPTFPILWDSDESLTEETGLEAMPTSYLIDRSGKIRFIHAGWFRGESAEKLSEEIELLLEESP